MQAKLINHNITSNNRINIRASNRKVLVSHIKDINPNKEEGIILKDMPLNMAIKVKTLDILHKASLMWPTTLQPIHIFPNLILVMLQATPLMIEPTF